MYDPCGDPDDYAACSRLCEEGELGVAELVEYRGAVEMQHEAGSQYCPDSQWDRWVKNHEMEIAFIDEQIAFQVQAEERRKRKQDFND